MPTNTRPPQQPPGVEGDGLDVYPTYHDGATSPARPGSTSGAKPTDVGLARSRRTSALPIFLGLVVFAIAIIAYLLLGGYNAVRTTDAAMTPGKPAAAASTPAADPNATGGTGSSATLDKNNAAQAQTGPGAVPTTPSATDVPGGGTTSPAQTAPAQTAPAQ